MLVHRKCEEPDDSLVTAILGLEKIDELGISPEFNQIIKT